MKKYMLSIILAGISLPVFAVCSITGGACTATSNWDSKPLQQKYAPNNLNNLQRADAFQPQYVVPFRDALINTEPASAPIKTPTNNYNSNCQFGVCLPSVEPGVDVLE